MDRLVGDTIFPDTSEKIDRALNLENNNRWPTSVEKYMSYIGEGHNFSVPTNLFEKLSDTQISEMQHLFSGDAT